jgi:hypothetical protein
VFFESPLPTLLIPVSVFTAWGAVSPPVLY